MKYKVGDKVRIINNKKGYNHRTKYIGMTATVECINPNGEHAYDEPHYSLKKSVPFVFFESELTSANTRKIVITSDGTETLARLYDNNKVVKSATAKCSPEDEYGFSIGAKLAFDRLIGEEKASEEWRVVHRPARAGDYVRLKKESFSFNEVGDILKVAKIHGNNCILVKACAHPRITGAESDYMWCYSDFCYEVVEPCTEEKKEQYYNGKVVCVKKGACKAYTVGKIYEFKDGNVINDNGIHALMFERIKTLDEWHEKHSNWAEFIPLVEETKGE